MKRRKPFRLWYYLRTGYQVYFTFIFATVNVMTVTYYLAIENLPILKEVFPNFANYVITMAVIGIPVLVFAGWLHFRRSVAYKSEIEIAVTSNPYTYKIPPGWWLQVVMPFFLSVSNTLVKLSNKESLSEEELDQFKKLEEKMKHLIKGGYVGNYRQADFKDTE